MGPVEKFMSLETAASMSPGVAFGPNAITRKCELLGEDTPAKYFQANLLISLLEQKRGPTLPSAPKDNCSEQIPTTGGTVAGERTSEPAPVSPELEPPFPPWTSRAIGIPTTTAI